MRLYLYTDGGSRGNPGPSAIGGICHKYDDKHTWVEVFRFSKPIGEGTNNRAEYMAIVEGLRLADAFLKPGDELTCYLDSELVVKQLNGKYKVRDAYLRDLWSKAFNMSHGRTDVATTFNHVPRHQNQEADSLVNKALDMRGDRG